MDACGIAAGVQEAIMDPRLWDMALDQSCLYWVRDTVDIRHAVLREIQRTSRERAMQLLHTTTGDNQEGRRAEVSTNFHPSP